MELARTSESPSPLPSCGGKGSTIAAAGAVVFASAMALAMQGYQFGQSNHTVYLLDALRHAHPELLENDWFATQTLQYHAVFGWMTRWLYAAGAIRPAFLVGYVLLVVLMHVGWWRIVRALRGDWRVFLSSAVIFQLAAGGTALGMYQFLQDGAFLPSNIAAVAMLWGIAMALEDRAIPSGLCAGVAGLFHLNYALVSPVLWVAMHLHVVRRGSVWIGAAAAIVPCAVNILIALGATRARSGAMPLTEFVALYVRLRHPHHYDPSSWPVWLWLGFALPIPAAVVLRTNLKMRRILLALAAILVLALIGAGLFYTSETLVQASLYRFSIFAKLLTCIAAGIVIARWRPHIVASAGVGVVLLAVCIWRGPYGGLFRVPADDASYLAACDWIREQTDVKDVFIVPPSEQEFRLRAQRAIVVNFKGVPQLSAELREWRDRLEDVLDEHDLTKLPRPFTATLEAIRERYDAVPAEHLVAVAKKYHARYVMTMTRWPGAFDAARVDLNNSGWFLYDCSRIP